MHLEFWVSVCMIRSEFFFWFCLINQALKSLRIVQLKCNLFFFVLSESPQAIFVFSFEIKRFLDSTERVIKCWDLYILEIPSDSTNIFPQIKIWRRNHPAILPISLALFFLVVVVSSSRNLFALLNSWILWVEFVDRVVYRSALKCVCRKWYW